MTTPSPCPCCGARARLVEVLGSLQGWWYIACSLDGGCGLTTGVHGSREEALEVWNRRERTS